MANFKDKMKNKTTIGKRAINSDEAIGLSFKNNEKTLSSVKLEALTTNPYQPRKDMNQYSLEDLKNSISSTGLLQPILISPIQNNPNKFYIIAGHRRAEAHKQLDLTEIDAFIHNVTDTELKTYSIIENIQRENLSVLDEAFAIKALLDSGLKQVDISSQLSKDKTVISKYLKITTIDKEVLEYMTNMTSPASFSLLSDLSTLPLKKQLEAFKYIEKHALKRDSTREYFKELKEGKKVAPAELFSGFNIKHNKNKISFKLDLDKLEDTSEAIIQLENILEELKKVVPAQLSDKEN